MIRKICTLILGIAISLSASAAQNSRRELPSFFYDSYIGLGTGYGKFNFTNDQMTAGYSAHKIDNQRGVARIYIGHYVTPYLAIQISLMRPFRWIEYSSIQNNEGSSRREF